MPPLTPRRIRAMPKVCLRLGQKLARGFEIGLVHEDLGGAGHRAASVGAAGGDVSPAVIAFDPVHAQQAAEGLGLELIPDDGQRCHLGGLYARPERKPKAYARGKCEALFAEGLTWGSRSSEDPRRLLPSPS